MVRGAAPQETVDTDDEDPSLFTIKSHTATFIHFMGRLKQLMVC